MGVKASKAYSNHCLKWTRIFGISNSGAARITRRTSKEIWRALRAMRMESVKEYWDARACREISIHVPSRQRAGHTCLSMNESNMSLEAWMSIRVSINSSHVLLLNLHKIGQCIGNFCRRAVIERGSVDLDLSATSTTMLVRCISRTYRVHFGGKVRNRRSKVCKPEKAVLLKL